MMKAMIESAKYEFAERLPHSISLWRYTLYSALLKIKLRNANSKLGILWEPISTFLVSLVLSLVWVKVLNITDTDGYFTYVYLGMVIWAAIASSISNLSATLLKNSGKMITKPISMYSYIFEDMLLSFVPLILSLPLVAIVLLWGGVGMTSAGVFFFILGIANLFFAAFGFAISVGAMAFLIGDIRQLITSVMRLGFLVTPVIWMTDRLGDYEKYLIFNPFYGFLHVIRQSLMGGEIKIEYVIQSLVISSFLVVSGLIIVSKFSVKIQEKALSS